MSALNMAEYMATRRAKRREELVRLAGRACAVCGSQDDLEFDHKDRSNKKFNLSGCALDKSWGVILEEFAKCDLLCRKHHKIKTRKKAEFGGGQNKVTSVCGSPHAYNLGCRCLSCKRAKVLYRNKKISYHETI